MASDARSTPRLIPLGEGVYTVAEVCRILQPTMTRHKVHHWLNTGLLSEPPVAHMGTGVPTLLSFKQLLEVRTVQHMRDELRVPLPVVRSAFAWVLDHLFAESPVDVRFEPGRKGRTVIVRASEEEAVEIPTGQRLLPIRLDALNETVRGSRVAWEQRALAIPGHPNVVANAHVLAGAPTIKGTRLETAVVAAFRRPDGHYDDDVVQRVRETYPRLSAAQVSDAMEFEGIHRLAS